MKKRRLEEAVDLIADELLDEYFEQDALFLKRRRQKQCLVKRVCVSAACLCIAFVLGALTMAQLNSEPTPTRPATIYVKGLGESVTATAGQTVILKATPGVEYYSFTVTKEAGEMPLCLYMSDYAVVEEWIEEKKHYVKMIVPASDADESQRGQDMIIMPMLMLVNGIPTNEMPTQAGKYRVELGYAQAYTIKQSDPETLLQMLEFMTQGQLIYENLDGE